MPNQELQPQYLELITRYLSGDANQREVDELEQWVSASLENRAAYKEIKKTWTLSGMAKADATIDVEGAWQKTSAALFDKTKVASLTPTHTLRRWLSIAASLLLLAVASFAVYQQVKGPRQLQAATTSNKESIELSDGSRVVLNRASQLSFNTNEDTHVREVDLSGDAFFDVARDENRPFVIQAGGIEVEVLGTSFYVDARKNQDEIQVVVESGQVAVRINGSEEILSANETAIYQRDARRLMKQANTDANFMSVKTNKLLFENSLIPEVVFAINRHFNANILIKNKSLENCRLTSTFDNKSLPATLAIIESSLGITIRETKNQILFEGKCTLD